MYVLILKYLSFIDFCVFLLYIINVTLSNWENLPNNRSIQIRQINLLPFFVAIVLFFLTSPLATDIMPRTSDFRWLIWLIALRRSWAAFFFAEAWRARAARAARAPADTAGMLLEWDCHFVH